MNLAASFTLENLPGERRADYIGSSAGSSNIGRRGGPRGRLAVLGGFTASALTRWLKSDTGERLAGAIVLAFGVFMFLYALRLGVPWLYREERPFLTRVRPGRAGAFPLGMAFAIGWTPCIGP